MNIQDLAIATITWVRDEAEEDVLRESIELLSSLGIPVFIADGGSPEHFISFMKALPNVQLVPSHAGSLWGQVKASLTAASNLGRLYTLYTEPDKRSFFTQLVSIIEGIKLQEQSGVILMARSARGFSSFPQFQQMTETTINNCCRELLQLDVDYCYGPFLINRTVVDKLLQITENTGWGWRPLAFALAYNMNYTIEAITKDFMCPPNQMEDSPNERRHRIKQLGENIKGLLAVS